MTAMTKMQAKTLLLAAMREAEWRLELEEGAIRSDRRHKPVAIARRIIMLIGLDECGFSTVQLGRIMRRDHSTCVVGAQAARELIAHEPWRSLHADLVAYVRHGTPLTPPAPPKPDARTPDEPAPEPEPRGAPEAMVEDVPAGAGNQPTEAELWPVWPGRDYYERQNAGFVAAMRRAHPELECEIRRASA